MLRRRQIHVAPFRAAACGLALGTAVAGGLAMNADAAPRHTAKTLVVSAVQNSTLGTILVSGRAVYALNNKTDCTGACLKIWPQVLLPKGAKKPTAGSGVSAAKLGTVRRNGRLQVTYSGKPLFYFYADRAGQVLGNAVTDRWGTWSAIVIAAPQLLSEHTATT